LFLIPAQFSGLDRLKQSKAFAVKREKWALYATRRDIWQMANGNKVKLPPAKPTKLFDHFGVKRNLPHEAHCSFRFNLPFVVLLFCF
jgi:hypothetical protein